MTDLNKSSLQDKWASSENVFAETTGPQTPSRYPSEYMVRTFVSHTFSKIAPEIF